jgi:hypothetical protein
LAFYSTVSVLAKDRDDEIKRLKRAGPGSVAVEGMITLPNGFLAVSLVHLIRGQRAGFTTIVTKPESESFSVR